SSALIKVVIRPRRTARIDFFIKLPFASGRRGPADYTKLDWAVSDLLASLDPVVPDIPGNGHQRSRSPVPARGAVKAFSPAMSHSEASRQETSADSIVPPRGRGICSAALGRRDNVRTLVVRPEPRMA